MRREPVDVSIEPNRRRTETRPPEITLLGGCRPPHREGDAGRLIPRSGSVESDQHRTREAIDESNQRLPGSFEIVTIEIERRIRKRGFPLPEPGDRRRSAGVAGIASAGISTSPKSKPGARRRRDGSLGAVIAADQHRHRR